ncbi:uncharacterized protein J4E88_009944 [Alternaria novae-zelandiae]|uniref:uncharacterized protein n=1 Tax=Alternaria novae-zelandiae TaxID=430562 RepID=UPI0020C1DC84|nr:uncharacterized protein J4E88_009944 [Alternaria novae-zelandiae]KAI4669662.1 hypothetical protein J4E88_009944 [Alternaria novae-zelandiae]
MEVRTPPAVGFFLDHEYVSRALRHIHILKHIEAPDRAKLNRTRPHQRRSNLTAKTRQQFQNLKQKLAKITAKLDQLETVLQQYLNDHMTYRHGILLGLLETKFARELRDEVYGYMIGGDQLAISINHHDLVATASPAFAIPGHTSASRSRHFQTSLERNGYGHLLEARAILKDTMLELAHAWYGLSTFRFMQAIHVEVFLRTDFHGFGLDTQKLIRSIEGKLFTPVNSSGDCDKLAKDLAELHTLKTGANILLSFQAIQTVAARNVVADSSAAIQPRDLALLFPGIQKLITAEYRVTVKLGYHLKFKVVSEEMTEECWKEKLEDHDKIMLAKRALRE